MGRKKNYVIHQGDTKTITADVSHLLNWSTNIYSFSMLRENGTSNDVDFTTAGANMGLESTVLQILLDHATTDALTEGVYNYWIRHNDAGTYVTLETGNIEIKATQPSAIA